MKQRAVTDQNNTTWTCVQAYTSWNGETNERATEISSDEEGHVSVICTPSGGAQSVRLELNPDWAEAVPDEELVAAIVEQQE